MLTLYDYLPSQNGYKVRLLLNHLGRPYRSVLVPIFAGGGYTIADMSVFAYVSRAHEADLPLSAYPAVDAWVARVRAQRGFLDTVYPYAIDPQSALELP